MATMLKTRAIYNTCMPNICVGTKAAWAQFNLCLLTVGYGLNNHSVNGKPERFHLAY